jgi:PAS domain S-box-containing protein
LTHVNALAQPQTQHVHFEKCPELPMRPATLTFDLDGGAVFAADTVARRLLGERKLVGRGISELFPKALSEVPSTGCRWLRFADGRRHYLRWACAACADRGRHGVLILSTAEPEALHAAVAQRFSEALEDLQRGGPFEAALRIIAKTLCETLDLPLVRVLVSDGEDLREQVAEGSRDCAEALRLGVDSLEVVGAGSGQGAAVRALRAGTAVFIDLAAAPQALWKKALRAHGAAAVGAWPLSLGARTVVFELAAGGAGDFEEACTAKFLGHWMPWLESRLAARGDAPQQQLVAEALSGAATPAFITDRDGAIVWVNEAFTQVYGRQPEEALGANPRLLQSGEHGQRYYQALWSALRAGRPWSSETVDRSADGDTVIVRQTITPVRHGGHITHFLAIHADVTDEVQLRRIGERQRGTDELSGLLTRAAFEERAREALLSEEYKGHGATFLLGSITTRFGGRPTLAPETQAYVRGALGERVRSVLGENTLAGAYGPFDVGVLLGGDEDAAAVAHKLAGIVRAPLPLLGETLQLRCQTATARFPQDGRSIAELHRVADRVLARTEPDPKNERPEPAD